MVTSMLGTKKTRKKGTVKKSNLPENIFSSKIGILMLGTGLVRC
jgi:hypothetical protein